jgi:hypothetical protein
MITQDEIETIYEAIDQLEGHAANTIGHETANMIAMKANNILRKYEAVKPLDIDDAL